MLRLLSAVSCCLAALDCPLGPFFSGVVWLKRLFRLKAGTNPPALFVILLSLLSNILFLEEFNVWFDSSSAQGIFDYFPFGVFLLCFLPFKGSPCRFLEDDPFPPSRLPVAAAVGVTAKE